MQELNPIPTPSDFLMDQWRKLNDDHFGGRLQEPPEVDWVEGISAFGQFGRVFGAIGINAQFRDVEESVRAAKVSKRMPTDEECARLVFVLGILLHEMVHQALHSDGSRSGAHADEFVAMANSIDQVAELKWPVCTADNAARWPFPEQVELD